MLDEDPTDFVIEFFQGFKVVPINFKGPFQDLQHRVLQSRYNGQSIPIVDRGFAIPVDEMAPSFFYDRQKGCGIPRVHRRIDHQFGATRGNQHVPKAITPAATKLY